MRKHERGVTLIGWLFLLLPIALIVYAGIRVTPVYLNYFRVVRSLEQLATDSRGESQINPVALRASIEKRFDVEYVDHPAPKDIDIHRDGDHWVAVADYEDIAPLFANVSVLMQFHKQVDLQ
jgi:hypothetical protein